MRASDVGDQDKPIAKLPRSGAMRTIVCWHQVRAAAQVKQGAGHQLTTNILVIRALRILQPDLSMCKERYANHETIQSGILGVNMDLQWTITENLKARPSKCRTNAKDEPIDQSTNSRHRLCLMM